MTFYVEVFNFGSHRSTLRCLSMPKHDPTITFVNIAVYFVQHSPRCICVCARIRLCVFICFARMNCAAILWLQWLTAIDKNFLTLPESSSVIWKYVFTKLVQVKPYFISIQQSCLMGLMNLMVFFPPIFIKINQIQRTLGIFKYQKS